MSRPSRVQVVEIAPRELAALVDDRIDAATAARVVPDLVSAGARRVEVGFPLPTRFAMTAAAAKRPHVPARRSGIQARVTTLVSTRRELEEALVAGSDDVAVEAAATDTYHRAQLGTKVSDALREYSELARVARRQGVRVRGHVSVAYACPFEGEVRPQRVETLAKRLLDLGCHEVSLRDTHGRAHPDSVARLVDHLRRDIGSSRLAMHFHDGFGFGLANVMVALERGIETYDSAAGGIGGSPLGGPTAGNLATEDLIGLLDALDIHHSLDLDAVVGAVAPVFDAIDALSPSRIHQAVRHATSRAELPLPCA